MERLCKCSFVIFLATSSLVLCQDIIGAVEMRKIPDGIKLGVASAAFQIEGAWNASDKSPSIWDTFCHQPNRIKDNTTGDDACESYKYYQRDIKMIKYLGVNAYRFSISWPRVLPNGFSNKISKAGTEYYSKLIDGLLENGIEPIITMYHWDLPQILQDLGGWANPLIVHWFEDYARVLFTLYGDRVKTWVTLNEPKQFGIYGYGSKRFAPALDSHGTGEYLAVKNLLLAHAKAWHLYDKEFRPTQRGIIGITIATDWREGMTDTEEDVIAGRDAMDFEVGLYSHPIFSDHGGFPESVVRLVGKRSAEQGYSKSRLPTLNEQEVEFIKGTSDFYGFNHYSSRFYTRKDFVPGMYPIPSYNDDIGATSNYKDYKLAVLPHCTEIPEGMRKALRWVKETCNDPPIMITENGFGTLGGRDDPERIQFLSRYIDSMLDAVEIDKCNVIMYTVWCLMDNFEWDNGLSVRFGVFETDYKDEMKTRRPKASALWYKKLTETRMLDPDYKPVLEDLEF